LDFLPGAYVLSFGHQEKTENTLFHCGKPMTENKKSTKLAWVDPDDAPDMGDGDFFDRGDWYHGETLVRRGRPKLEQPKVSTTLRLDHDVIQRFKAKGPRWQSRINQALREWLDKAG
jgi:BrnA antitoxin of type II toxin-antitoxin system